MKIGINTLAYLPERSGGDGTYVRELTRALTAAPDANEYVLFVTPWNAAHLPAPGPRIHHVVCHLRTKSLVARVAYEQSVLPIVINRERLDIIHSPVNVAPLAAQPPSVLTLLEAEPFMWPQDLPRHLAQYWRLFRRLSAKRAQRILTISEAGKSELVEFMGVPAHKIAVAYLGVDHQRFHPASRGGQDLGLKLTGAGYLFWAGRSYPRKNLPRIVTAFAELGRQGFAQQLVIAGASGWEDRRITSLIGELHLEEKVIWAGRVDDSRLPLLYAGAQLFAFPSLHEAFGLPIVEAMASGSPVLTSNRGAMREIAGGTALLVDPTDTGSIAGGMASLLSNGALRGELIAGGLRRAAEFRWSFNAEKTLKVYSEACRGSGDEGRLAKHNG